MKKINLKEERYALIFKFILCFVYILFLILVNILHFQYIKNNKVIVVSGAEYAERKEDEYIWTPAFKTSEDYIEQPFYLGSVYLESIKIRLAISHETLDGLSLRIMLCKDGTVIKEQEITHNDFVSWGYYEFEIGEQLRGNHEYTLRLQQFENTENGIVSDIFYGSYSVANAVVHVEENAPNYIYNGEQQDGEFELIYSYNYINYKSVVLLVFLDVLVLCLLWIVMKKQRHTDNQKLGRWIEMFYYIFTPLITVCMVECITGNIKSFNATQWYLKNLVIYYLLYYILLFCLRNFKIVTFGYMTIFVVMGLVYYFVLLFRGRAFMLQDIFSAGTAMAVADNYSYELPVRLMIVLLFYLCLTALLFSINVREYIFKKIKNMLITAVCVIGCFVFVYVRYNGILREVNPWDVSYTYQESGLMVGLLSEIPYLWIEQPENYSVDAVKKIADEMSQAEVDKETAVTPQNIILIMNEAFADLDYISEIDTDTELLSYWKNLHENAISGYLNMPSFGGGTSNSEYEVLTGNSLEFLCSGVCAYQMNVKDNDFSLVSTLKGQQFKSLAFHPHLSENYNRANVYKYFGFDTFYSGENCFMGDIEFASCYIKDSSVYEELIKEYEATDSNLFEFCVTLQNHSGYTNEDYETTVKLNYSTKYPQAEEYLTLIQESDSAFENLIKYFSGVDEPTMVVMFGDHQPSVNTEFYEELYGKPLAELSFEERQMQYVTPFKIWTNYDIEEQTDVHMSANYFGSYILQVAGLKMSGYNRFLLKLYEEIPIIGTGGICDKNGVWYTWDDVPEQYYDLINNYKILQYNNVYDMKHRVDSFFEAE